MSRTTLERSRRRQRLVTATALVVTIAASSFGVAALFAPTAERATIAELFPPTPQPRPGVDDGNRLPLTGRGGNLRLPVDDATSPARDHAGEREAPRPPRLGRDGRAAPRPTVPTSPSPRATAPSSAPTTPTSTSSTSGPTGGPDSSPTPGTTPPSSAPPSTNPPASTPPSSAPPVTKPPTTTPPATTPPTKAPPTTKPPTSGRPDGGSTGVPSGIKLKVHEGDLTITEKGTVVDGLDVRGAIRIKASDVTIKNTKVRGRPVSSIFHLVQIADDAKRTKIVDSEIFGAHPSPYVMGVVGASFTLERVDIHTVIDQVTIIGDDVTIKDSWLHGNLFYANDPNHGGGPSHDDNIQIQVGSNLRLVGSRLEDSSSAAIMITQGRGAVSDTTVESSWIDGGSCSVNISELTHGPLRGITFRNNVFGTATRHAYCALLVPVTTTVSQSGNSFTDGTAFRVSKG